MRPGTLSSFPITAYAATNALGATTREVLAGLEEGRSGLGAPPFELPFPTAVGTVAGELEPLPEALKPYDCRQARITFRLVRELIPVLERLRARRGSDRIGIVLGTSTAGLEETERAFGYWKKDGAFPASYDWDRQHAAHGALDLVRALTGFSGPGYVLSSACSSSGKVFGSAQRLLRAGVCDAVLVGGIDSLCRMTLHGFHSLAVLSPEKCRPFGLGRTGINIGEGGALCVLEKDGEGPAVLRGVGETSDAHHMTSPHPEGLGARAAMEEALRQAGADRSEVDHVNAHGTATPQNDVAEAKAIRDAVGTEVPVASTKGYTGHLLGAAGATEAIFSIVAIERGWLPASLGADPIDPAITLNVLREKKIVRPRLVLSNSFAFGGNNVCVAFGAPR